MKVVAIIMNVVRILGLIVTAGIPIRANYYSDEHSLVFLLNSILRNQI